MMIKTFDLWIYTQDKTIEYLNISKSAVKYFIAYHQECEDFYGYDLENH